MRAKRSTDQSKTEEGAAQKPRPERNPAKTLSAGDERFKSIFDESPIGIELYDSDGLLMDANPACLRMFGVADIAQVKGFKLFEDPNLPDEAKAKLRRGKAVRYEVPFGFEKVKELRLYETSKSGVVHLDVLITPVGVKRKAAPQGYLVQVQDITERKQTEEMLRRHAEELAALQATTLDLAAQQDLLSLLNTIVERAMALLDAPCGFIYLHDAKTNELEMVVERGLNVTPGLRLRMGEGMAGRVAQTRKTLVVDDYSTWEGRSPHFAAVPYHAVVEVPMLFGGQLIGVLGVNEISAATRRYNEADARLLSLFAGQAASAVRNARLFQGLQAELAERKRTEQTLLQTERRYRTLFELSPDGILLIDPKTALPIVFNTAAHSQLGYSREEFARLRIADYEVIEKPEVTQAHIEKIMQEGRDDFETLHRTKQGEIRNVHVTVQTIELAGRPVLNSIFHDITARKQVEERLRQRVEELAALQATVLGITAPHDLPTLLHTIVERAAMLINAPSGGMYLCDPEKKEVRCVVSYNTPGDYTGTVLKYGDGAAGFVAETREPLIIDDYRSWRKRADVFEEKQPFSAVLSVPMIWQNQATGVIHVLHYEKGRRFTQADLELLTLFANHAAIAVKNARLYEAAQRELTERKQAEKVREITYRISQAAVSTESLEELYHSIHGILGELMPVENFYIALYDPVSDLLNFPYFVDQYDQSPQPMKARRGLTKYVLRTGQPLLASPEVFDQLLQQGEVELVGTNSVDWLGVPLNVKQRVIGVMVTQSYTEGIRFSQEDADLLTFVSTQVAMAIERKRAEQEILRWNAELTALNQIGQKLNRLADPFEILELIYTVVGHVLDNRNLYIALYDEANQSLSFPVYTMNGERRAPASRSLGNGLTEYVIRTRAPLLIPENLQAFLEEQGIDSIGLMAHCFLATPMLAGEKVIGVIAIQDYEREKVYDASHVELLSTVASQAAIAIENARLYTSLGNEKQRLELLYNLSHHLTASLDSYQEVATTALDHICTALGAFKGAIYVPRPEMDRWELLAASGMKPAELEAFNQYTGMSLASGLTGWAASHKKTAVVPDVAKDKRWETIPGLDEWVRSAMSTPLLAGNTIIGVLNLLSDQIAAFREEDVEIVKAAAAPIAIALQNARLYAAEKRRAERLAEIAKIGIDIADLHEASAVLRMLVKRAAALMESTTCTVMLIDTVTNEAYLAAQTGLPESTSPELRVPLELPILRHSVETGQPVIIPDINHDAPAMRAVLVRPDVRAFFAYPMIRAGRAIGFITFSKLTPHTPSTEEVAACQLLAERAAVALENARLSEETARSLRQVQALHTIDMTIASSFDLHLTFSIFLEQARAQLGVDAVDVLVYNPHAQMLDYAAGIGFRTTALQGTHMRLGQGYAGIAGLERKTIHVSNLHEHKTDFLRSPNFKAEEFDTYFGVPLIAKGLVKGVLEVFHRSPLQPDQNWMDFMETLAKQAAIGIDNATLFSDLQSSNTELILAYDTTLAGWSKALDLRDKETEGHTQRVVETTMRLARAMGVAEVDLPNVRRGALLHDIGKMGIPDDILHKPGPLTAEDWAIMRQHPVYARELLSPITYLRPAMDIPYYHHEKWDGSGYPNGLKGEQIPMAARIFAVVDVFDALTSDRSYRSAWPREEALEYIREQAGQHFDPAVVEMFLRMVEV